MSITKIYGSILLSTNAGLWKLVKLELYLQLLFNWFGKCMIHVYNSAKYAHKILSHANFGIKYGKLTKLLPVHLQPNRALFQYILFRES